MESGEGCEQFQAEKPMGRVAWGRGQGVGVCSDPVSPGDCILAQGSLPGAGTGAKGMNVSAHAAPAQTSGDGSFKLSKS